MPHLLAEPVWPVRMAGEFPSLELNIARVFSDISRENIGCPENCQNCVAMIPHCTDAYAWGTNRATCTHCEEHYGVQIGGSYDCFKCEDNARFCVGLVPHCIMMAISSGVRKCTECEDGWGVHAMGDAGCTSILIYSKQHYENYRMP